MNQGIDQHSHGDQVDFRPLHGRRLFQRTVWLCRAHILACVLLNLYVFVLLACLLQDALGNGLTLSSYGFSESPLQWSTLGWVAGLVVLQVVSFQGLMIATLQEDGQITLFPEDESGTRSFGGMRGEQIVSLVHEMADQMGAGKIGKIVILDSPCPNAQTVWLLGDGNIVTLHSNLLEVLSLEGIRSTIAHELAHVRRKDFLSRHLLHLPTRFVPCITFLALLKIGAGLGVMASWPTFIGQSLVIVLLAQVPQ
jgi:Zn-dependent protease with chaperone function